VYLKWSLILRFSKQNLVCIFISPNFSMFRPPHPSRFNHRLVLGEEYKSWNSSLCSLLQSFVTANDDTCGATSCRLCGNGGTCFMCHRVKTLLPAFVYFSD
jgi:hypothetical protein